MPAAIAVTDARAEFERAVSHLKAGRVAQATEALTTALARAPDDPQLHNRAGDLLARIGQPAAAEAAFVRAVELNPGLAAARYNLGLIRASNGDHEGAAKLLVQVCRERPELPAPWLQLGGVLNALGRYDAAESALMHYLKLDAGSVPGWTWLGAARQFQGRFDDAETCYRRAVELDPGAADAHANLGRLLQAQGMPAAAAASLEAALAVDGGHRQARAGLAALRDNEGRYEEALAIAVEPDGSMPPETAAIGARILRHLGRLDEARRTLEGALASPGLAAEAEVQLRFSLGRVLDEAGDYDGAARCFADANRRQRHRFGTDTAAADTAALATAADRLSRAFGSSALASLPRSTCDSGRPLFVVGMPRAGKSLVEQILCSHPQIKGAGELTDIPDIAAALAGQTGPWPESVSQLTVAQLDEGAERYLARLAALAPDAACVTDTMPFNFMHIGLIELLFPRARVVHCVRHPADLALRCFAKNFAGHSLAFTTDLSAFAGYLAGYRRIMRHWDAASGLAIHRVRYEDLVRRPEEASRALIDFAGLPWSDDCLRFYEPGVATSASDTPVRRPLSDREAGAWTHYRTLLADVLDRLDIEAYDHDGL